VVSPDYRGDMNAYLASLETIQALDFTLLVPSHGLPLWGAAGREVIKDTLAHRLDREATIQAHYDAGARTTAQLLEAAYGDVPREAWPIAEHQLRAHLERLQIEL